MKRPWTKAGVGILATIGAVSVYPVMTVASPAGVCVSGGRPNLGGRKWSAFRAISSQPTGPSGAYEPVRLQPVWLNESELQISYQVSSLTRCRVTVLAYSWPLWGLRK